MIIFKLKMVFYVEKRKCIELNKKEETEISMNKSTLTSLNYGYWIKSITKNMLGER